MRSHTKGSLLAIAIFCVAGSARATDGLFDLGTFGGANGFASDISGDGNVVVGTAGLPGGNGHAFRWTFSGGMQDLGAIGGPTSFALGTNQDGSVITGSTGATGFEHPFRWTSSEGMVDLGTLGGLNGFGRAVSSDGSTIVGQARLANADLHAFRWTSGGGLQDLGTAGGNSSFATAVSRDGAAVAGNTTNGLGQPRAFRWTTLGGLQDLGTLGGASSNVGSNKSALSLDGSVVVGASEINFATPTVFHAFRWTAGGGMQDLGTLGGANSSATVASSDGSVVGGSSERADMIGQHAFRWSSTTGMQALGSLGGLSSFVQAMNPTGTVLVGAADLSTGQRAYRWSAQTGMLSVEDWLSKSGVVVSVNGPTTTGANGVSDDGTVVVGALSNNHPFVARVSGSGSGLIDLPGFYQSLESTGYAVIAATSGPDLVLNGAHGSPMRGLLDAGRHSVWVSGDIARDDHNAAEGYSGVGEVGFAKSIFDGGQFNVAVGRTYSRQNTVIDGRTTFDGTYLLPEFNLKVPKAPVWMTLSGLYSFASADIDRAYLNAGTRVVSSSTPDAWTAGGRLRFDWLNALEWQKTGFTPYASYTHLRTHVGQYTEDGGGFPVTWRDRTEHSNTLRLGLDAAHRFDSTFTLLGRIEGAHRFESKSADLHGELSGPGGFPFELEGVEYQQNWVRGAVGLEVSVGAGTGSVMLNATSEGQVPSYWLMAGYKFVF